MVTSMRACVQRVSRAKVVVEGQVVGEIGLGLLILLGVGHRDTEAEAAKLAEKIVGLRVFEDQQQKMNLSISDVGGAILVVSQFTLFADCRKGRRPSFTDAAPPQLAEQLYDRFVRLVADKGIPVATGQFRQYMQVELVNEGPVTLWLDTAEW